MKQEQKQQIKAALSLAIKNRNLSQNKAAQMIGVSGALLSNLLSDKWEQISEDKWLKVAAFCGVKSNSWKLRETANLTAIQKLCTDAQENSRFLAISDRSGLGKTTALKYFSNNTSSAFYTLCTVTMSRKDFLTAIQQSIGIEAEGSIHAKINSIIQALTKEEKPLLILDDAAKLNDSNLRLIQVIYDALEFRCGIVMAGTEQLKKYILKMASKDKLGFRELKRRVGYWCNLQGISRRWLAVVCADYGIKDVKTVNLIHKIAPDYGTLRELLSNYARANKEGFTELEVIEGLQVGTND